MTQPKHLAKLKVDVTQIDIDRGEPMTCCACPVARAINRPLGDPNKRYPGIELASVRLTEGHLTHGFPFEDRIVKHLYKFDLPEKAQRFVRDWTDGNRVEPISFEIALRYHTDVLGGGTGL